MTDWRTVLGESTHISQDLDLDGTVAALTELLRSPDPAVRDEFACTTLGRLLPFLDSEQRHRLGNALLPLLDDAEVQARTFAPLILAALVRRGEFEPAWLERFEAWYPAETDLRGYDAKLGWLHAVAHGADLLGAFGRCEQVEPTSMLHLATKRLLAKTDYVLRDQEDDRLAYAIALTLCRAELGEAESVAWLDPIAADFRTGEPGPVPAYASNTMRTLRMLYLLVDRGVCPDWGDAPAAQARHRNAVREQLAQVLALVAPFTG